MSRGKEVKELREKMGMNRREFSDYYGIPYRTIQDWEAGEKRASGLFTAIVEIQSGNRASNQK